MGLEDQFNEAADKVKNGAVGEQDNDTKGRIYGLFKQSKFGDNNTDKPGMLSGFEARGKWDAWEAEKGKSQEEAMQEYVELVNGLVN